MRTIRATSRIPVAVVTCAVMLFGASCSSDSDSSSATTASAAATVNISVTAGVDSGEDRVEKVPLGSNVVLTVINPDQDDEFHVHGYELGDGVEVPQGEPEVFNFVANQAGQFEVESHTTEVVLLILDVS